MVLPALPPEPSTKTVWVPPTTVGPGTCGALTCRVPQGLPSSCLSTGTPGRRSPYPAQETTQKEYSRPTVETTKAEGVEDTSLSTSGSDGDCVPYRGSDPELGGPGVPVDPLFESPRGLRLFKTHELGVPCVEYRGDVSTGKVSLSKTPLEKFLSG